MGNSISAHRHGRSRSEARRFAHDPLSVRDSHGALDVPSVANHRVWHLEPPEAPAQERCRQILVDLLRPLGASAAAVWADLLVEEFGSLAEALAAPPSAQARVLGDGSAAVQYLRTVRDAMLHALRTEAFARPTL